MALSVENGTGIAGANSYVTVEEARAYALDRGLTLPILDQDVESLLIKGTDYLESLRTEYRGYKVFGRGYLQWPREEVYVDGIEVLATEIPIELKKAQCQLAIELQTIDPLPSTTGGPAIKREKVDVIETEYAVTSGGVTQNSPRIPKVDALLAPLLRSLSLTSIRI